MTKAELKKRESARRAKLIANSKARNEKKLAKRIEGLNTQYEQLFQKAMAKQLAKYERKKNIAINKAKKHYGHSHTDKTRAIRKLDKVVRISDKIRNKAINEYQLRIKLSKADKFGMIYLVDKGIRTHRTLVVAGHYFSKSRRPHLIFETDNVRAITSLTNFKQLDNEGIIWKEQLIAHIGQARFNELQNKANDKSLKNEIRDKQYYQNIYEIAKAKNAQEKKRLGKYYKNVDGLALPG